MGKFLSGPYSGRSWSEAYDLAEISSNYAYYNGNKYVRRFDFFSVDSAKEKRENLRS